MNWSSVTAVFFHRGLKQFPSFYFNSCCSNLDFMKLFPIQLVIGRLILWSPSRRVICFALPGVSVASVSRSALFFFGLVKLLLLFFLSIVLALGSLRFCIFRSQSVVSCWPSTLIVWVDSSWCSSCSGHCFFLLFLLFCFVGHRPLLLSKVFLWFVMQPLQSLFHMSYRIKFVLIRFSTSDLPLFLDGNLCSIHHSHCSIW